MKEEQVRPGQEDPRQNTPPENTPREEATAQDGSENDREESPVDPAANQNEDASGDAEVSAGDGGQQDPAHQQDPAQGYETRVAELEEENSDLKNQLLRRQADFENYRKRMVRDREDAVQYANQQLLLDLTSVIDDFERAIQSANESQDYDAFHKGVVLIEKQLTGMLERKWGLKRFESEGQEFDPQRHEAVTTEPREDHESSVVLEDYQKGYLLHERVLRTAKVKVSMPAGQ